MATTEDSERDGNPATDDDAYQVARARLDALESEPRARAQLLEMKDDDAAVALIRELAGDARGCNNLASALERGDGGSFVRGILARRRVVTAREVEKAAILVSAASRVDSVFGGSGEWWKS